MSEYAKALDELEAMRASGQITEGRYQEMHAKLLKEAAGPKTPSLGRRLLTGLVALVAVLVVITIVSRVYGVLTKDSRWAELSEGACGMSIALLGGDSENLVATRDESLGTDGVSFFTVTGGSVDGEAVKCLNSVHGDDEVTPTRVFTESGRVLVG